jgi:hypothetical protein
MKLLCRRLGFAPPARTVHVFRHIFARELHQAGRVSVPSSEGPRAFVS